MVPVAEFVTKPALHLARPVIVAQYATRTLHKAAIKSEKNSSGLLTNWESQI